MIELTIRELESVGKHLKKVIEIQAQNDEYDEELALDLPARIKVTRTANGLDLGHIQYSGDLEEYVFVPLEEVEPKAPHWANSIPTPPPFN